MSTDNVDQPSLETLVSIIVGYERLSEQMRSLIDELSDAVARQWTESEIDAAMADARKSEYHDLHELIWKALQ